MFCLIKISILPLFKQLLLVRFVFNMKASVFQGILLAYVNESFLFCNLYFSFLCIIVFTGRFHFCFFSFFSELQEVNVFPSTR